jgi:sodium transport system permease protein
MRWSIIRTIWFREMRDQLRDRRTLLVIVALPLILYPLIGVAVLRVAAQFSEKPSVVGVVIGSSKAKDFPVRPTPSAGRSAFPAVSWLSLTPPGPGLAQWSGACALARASQLHFDYPFLIEAGRFTPFDAKAAPKDSASDPAFQLVFLDRYDPNWQEERKLDLVLEAPDCFFTMLEQGEDDGAALPPALHMHLRPGDDRSRRAEQRLAPLFNAWIADLEKVRQVRKGLPARFLQPIEIVRTPDEGSGPIRGNLVSMVVRFFPLLLVLWTLSGALYPAIDLCAGEKERGTMETLLITPAGRAEIVVGKFLTIWVFSSGTALVNLLSMGITTAVFAEYLPQGGIALPALLWCVVLSLPQSAFFSALGLAIGAYARSSKEGQYYLMPLFVLTMPLICLTLVPGVELNPFYSLVPVTGVALLMQHLMTASLGQIRWEYFVPVLAPMALYSWLALRWAIEQFNREDVLFREAERLDIMLWLKRLLREKESTPTSGEAFFCLALLIGLRWLTLGVGERWSLPMYTAISQLAFVAMPALFMVLLLTTHPGEGLYLRWPRGRETWLAVVLALLLLPPMAGLTQAVAVWFPGLLEGKHPLIEILRAIHDRRDLSAGQFFQYILAFALVPALCEELAFRGFVLRGLHQGFRPRNAVLLSSLFFALFHLNVFLFVPTFLLGVVLGLLTVRSKSLLPAIAFHLLHNAVLILLIPLGRYSEGFPGLLRDAWPWLIGLCGTASAALLWWLYRKPYADLARAEALARENRIRNTDLH